MGYGDMERIGYKLTYGGNVGQCIIRGQAICAFHGCANNCDVTGADGRSGQWEGPVCCGAGTGGDKRVMPMLFRRRGKPWEGGGDYSLAWCWEELSSRGLGWVGWVGLRRVGLGWIGVSRTSRNGVCSERWSSVRQR